ncbi:MAG: peptidylprolyl isomerase [Kangiellaceae bacterium]|nr:peptidylprolyl isomerase [Kangiellaceae bacterium]
MIIEKDSVVQFTYKMSDDTEQVLEDNSNSIPMAYLHGHGGLLKGLEDAMEGKSAKQSFEVTLEPEDAYGIKKDNMEQKIPMKHLQGAKKWKKGMVGVVHTEQGNKRVTIIKPGKFMVLVDFNHPFAGLKLKFQVKIADVRAGTAEELAHGHAHGVGGHHH